MSLQIGQEVRAELSHQTLKVEKKLGEGTQGEVYLVASPGGRNVVKWYKPPQATDDQRAAITMLVQKGPPEGEGGKQFIWPQDVVTTPGTRQFGYLMRLIDTGRFAELGEVWARRKPQPTFPALCEISYQMSRSYRALHRQGYCYRDISAGNLMFDPKTGEVLICDNDNVGVNRQSKSQVWGTIEYMAPELILGTSDPSTDSDLHSLAVLLFLLWVWHHPMHGKMEYEVRAWDLPAKKMVYGRDPVFIFSPSDHRNELPGDPDYQTARKRWSYCPKALQDHFIEVFSVGLKDPAKRISEGPWQRLFLQLKDGAIACPHCRADNLWDPAHEPLKCWHCGRAIPLPPKLTIAHPGGRNDVLLRAGTALLRRHVDPYAEDESVALGQVVQNPANPQVWGIRNVSTASWMATMPDGASREIPPGKAVPINPGIKLRMGNSTGEIRA
jgi:eukaryotic-like serine/threonine-protein kinase